MLNSPKTKGWCAVKKRRQGTGKARIAIEVDSFNRLRLCFVLVSIFHKSQICLPKSAWKLDRPFEIVGYETISSSDRKYLGLLNLGKEYKKIFVVADESVFIKNDSSKRYGRILKLRDLSEYRLILNGTPITKDEWDIYNQMEFLSPKIFDMHRHEFLNTLLQEDFVQETWDAC